MIKVTNDSYTLEQVTGITNLSLGLWEYFNEEKKAIHYVYVSDPVSVETDSPYFKGVVLFSTSNQKIEKPLVKFYKWNTRVFTKSSKVITISN